jgi:L-rhamnose mutarotase
MGGPCHSQLTINYSQFIIRSVTLSSVQFAKKETTMAVQRYGMVIKVKPEKLALYRALHADPWPEVLATITACHIRNYSIYLKDNYLFSYFEYVGDDFAADMAKMAADPKTQEWWRLTDPCQEPLESRAPGEWWAKMEEVFHHD